MRFDEVCFLAVEDVHALHEDALAAAGGKTGLLSEGLIVSAVMAPQNSYCTSLAEMAATVAFGIAKNHGYQDANKRTAFSAMKAFLGMNGYRLELDDLKWASIMEGVADDSVSRLALAQHLVTEMGGDVAIE